MRFLFFIFWFSISVFGQTNPIDLLSKGIPDSWLGSYEGEMEIYNNNGLQQKIGVNLDLLIMDRPSYWTYNMTYINLKNGETLNSKAYKIFYEEATKKLWMDEGDSLLIEMTQMGNCFYDHYELGGMFYNSSLCQQGENLVFELTGGRKKPSYTSPFIEEAAGSVETMNVSFLQRVNLHKIK